MIDASRSPRAAWKRAVTLLTVLALILALAWVIWVRELHNHAKVQLPFAYGASPVAHGSRSVLYAA